MRYGEYEDDFDGHGEDRGVDRARDHDDERDHNDRDGGGGSGHERDDGEREDGLMTMTRRDSERDVRGLANASLDDMRRFIREREGDEDPMKSVTSNAVTGIEIGVGAIIAGFLAQRFKQAGAVVPVGVTLAALGLAAAQFNKAGKFSPDLRNISFGALASALALWAAGRGAITAEGLAFGPNTAGMLPPSVPAPAMAAAPAFTPPMQQPMMQPMMQQPPMMRPQVQPMMRPQPMPAFVQQAAFVPPVTGRMDFHNLVAQRVR